MKKSLLGAGLFCFLAALTISNSSGSPGGYSGSTSDGRTCGSNGGCHGGGVSPAEIISTNFSNGFVPGEEYEITVSASFGTNKYGFELSAEDNTGSSAGEFIVDSSDEYRFTNGDHVTHKFNSNSATAGAKQWTVRWLAPNDPIDVNFSVSVLAANSNGSSSGDNCFGDQLTVSANTSSVNENALSESFRYNAVNKEIELINPVTLSVYNLSGQELGKKQGVGSLSLNELQSGVYVLLVEQNKLRYTQRIWIK